MANGEFVSERKSDFYVRCLWSSVPEAASNTSLVTVQVYVGYYSVQIGSRSCICTIGSQNQSAAVGAISHSGSHKETLAGTFQSRVCHGADGTASVIISAGFPFNLTTSAGGYIGTLTASGTAVLDHIPQAAQVSAADTVLGNDVPVSFTPASASHSFLLALSVGAWAQTVQLSPGSTAPYTYRAALPFDTVAQQIPTAVGQLKAVLTTCAGDTVIGTAEAVCRITVPEDERTKPSLSVTVAADTALGDFYLQGKSRAKVTYDARGKLGASIVSQESTVLGSRFSDLSPLLTQPGQHTVVSTVTDSRGFTAKVENTITVYAYTSPYPVIGVCQRRGSDGASYDSAGTAVYLQARAVATKLPETVLINDAMLQISLDGGPWTTLQTNAHDQFSGIIATVPPDQTCHVALRVMDAVETGRSIVAEIPTAHAVFHLREGGGAAFGKYGEQADVLDIAENWALRVRGNRVTFGDAEEKEGFTCALDMDMSGCRISGLADAQNDTDAVSKKRLLALTYPVGSLHLRLDDADPADLFGGTWQRISDALLWAATDADAAGAYRYVSADESGMTLPAVAIRVWHRTA